MINYTRNLLLLLSLVFNFNFMNAQVDPWGEYLMPSEVHALMSKYTGRFKVEVTMLIGVDTEPTTITLDSDHTMLLGDRFLEMKQQGNMMGMDYLSILTIGYNNTDKKMALTTITNMGTGTLSLSGDFDTLSMSATLYGQLVNPVTKQVVNIKQVMTFLDSDTILIESYDQEGESAEKKTVTYKFIRKV